MFYENGISDNKAVNIFMAIVRLAKSKGSIRIDQFIWRVLFAIVAGGSTKDRQQ